MTIRERNTKGKDEKTIGQVIFATEWQTTEERDFARNIHRGGTLFGLIAFFTFSYFVFPYLWEWKFKK